MQLQVGTGCWWEASVPPQWLPLKSSWVSSKRKAGFREREPGSYIFFMAQPLILFIRSESLSIYSPYWRGRELLRLWQEKWQRLCGRIYRHILNHHTQHVTWLVNCRTKNLDSCTGFVTNKLCGPGRSFHISESLFPHLPNEEVGFDLTKHSWSPPLMRSCIWQR